MITQLTTDVTEAAATLARGGLVAFATETVYGLGANALNSEAVARIFEAKQRPLFDPLIVHLADPADVDQVCLSMPPLGQRLIDAFWPGPITLVVPKRDCVPDLVTSGLATVAVRVPCHERARELIRRAGVPVAAPSANLFGRVSPTCAEHVLEQLDGRIDAVLDGGRCQVGIESTVVSLATGDRPRLLRPGGVSLEAIREVIGDVDVAQLLNSDSPHASPGMLSQHYAPSKPLEVVADWSQIVPSPQLGALVFTGRHVRQGFGAVEVLSLKGSLSEAAGNLFAALRRMERGPIERILAEHFPEEGLGRAINDRLRRAAGKGV